MDFHVKSGPILHKWPFTPYCFTKALSKVSHENPLALQKKTSVIIWSNI